MTNLRRFASFLHPYRSRVFLAAGLLGLACLLNLAIPLLIQGLVDGMSTGNSTAIPFYTLALGLVFLAQAAVGLGNTFALGQVGLDVVRDLRHSLYSRLQRASLAYYDRTSAGSILSRLMDDVGGVQSLISNQSVAIVSELVTALVVAVLLASRSWLLFAVTLALLPAYVVGFHWFGRRIRSGAEEVRQQLDAVFGNLKAKFDGILVVKAHAREEAEIAEFAAQIDAAHSPRVRVERLAAALSSFSVAAGGIGAALIFALGAIEVVYGRLTPGDVVASTVLAALLFGPINRLADLVAIYQQASASARRLHEILDLKTELPRTDRPIPLVKARGLVEFDRVGFGYQPGKPVLRDISLRLDPGMKVAVVGRTGCGKTTLLNLLLRYYDPTWGEIRLDGVPLQALALEDLRRQVGVVPQEPVIFRLTLAENIRYGTPHATQEQVERAAQATLVDLFAKHLPQGYDTLIGEGGFKLSQGERQRIAIARALCKDPALIVLDEATSSLDTASEALIQAALANLLAGRTALIIAHRLATVVDADRIVVMDAGAICQVGAHAELLADTDCLYAQYCLRQFGILDSKLESTRSRAQGRILVRTP